ncbi:MAG: metalloregulator ArsR/SmtB family transcription factor [Streptococcaceae bacterium]|nr:metalloregulator ArsR/SmtB family transcription factor [Streptococcaceae bacterium]
MDHTQKRMKLIHGLANDTRLEVLEGLKSGEKTVSDLLTQIGCTQSNLSQHLTCLKNCGLIVGRQSGKYMYYTLADTTLLSLLEQIDETILALEWAQDETLACYTHEQ